MKHLILVMLYLSIYQSPSDPTKSVIECAYDKAKSDILVVDTKDLESARIGSWVLTTCLPKRDK